MPYRISIPYCCDLLKHSEVADSLRKQYFCGVLRVEQMLGLLLLFPFMGMYVDTTTDCPHSGLLENAYATWTLDTHCRRWCAQMKGYCRNRL